METLLGEILMELLNCRAMVINPYENWVTGDW